jgi:hypothetical protein
LLVDAEHARRVRVSRRLEVLQERVNGRRPGSGRVTHGVADAYDVIYRPAGKHLFVRHRLSISRSPHRFYAT